MIWWVWKLRGLKMGKHSCFDRKPRDYYPTPYEAVLPLLEYLPKNSKFVEPCAGDGRLIRHLQKQGHECTFACDIDPQNDEYSNVHIEKADVLFFGYELPKADFIITNTPWGRELLHPMIEIFRAQSPTWLLFDADWLFTKQAKPYKKYCKLVVPVGRVSWEGNGVAGKDNCAWYLFDKEETQTIIV